MKLIGILFAIVFMFLIAEASAEISYVSFIGNFSNGTTLYSGSYNYSQTSLSGKDAYPTRNCSVFNISSVTKKVCSTANRTRTCVNVTSMKTITRCQSLKAVCYNPYSHNTNQLSLSNFEYSPDNGASWHPVPYAKLSFSNVNLTFRLIIPAYCKPAYGLNNVIKLEY